MSTNKYIVSLAGERVEATAETWESIADALVAKHGGVPTVERVKEDTPPPAKQNSSFGGTLVVDQEAKDRIEKQHAALNAAGINVDAKEQLYATGTRMANVGYDTQRKRATEHAAKRDLHDAIDELTAKVEDEHRKDVEISAGDLARTIHVNGKITAYMGNALTEQAIRGLSVRLGSPMLAYILGLRNRCGGDVTQEHIAADKQMIADVLAHELKQAKDTMLKLRTRNSTVNDIFAVLSPSYGVADAPQVCQKILKDLPHGAKGSYSYDPTSTSWEIRGSVWTPTPAEEQAVGEPFEGYVSFSSRDDGTSRLHGGGGINLLRCLNASTYTASAERTSRVHRGKVMDDIKAMFQNSLTAINTLCEVWGEARATVIKLPILEQKAMPIEQAIPGFWRHLLRDRKSELLGILPGRSEEHVHNLSRAYFDQRRDEGQVVKADFAQGWTSYIQKQPTPVRRDGERAIATWLAGNRLPAYESE